MQVEILIADDEDSFLQSTAELLREDGYHCDAVSDGHQALERLQAKRYDLLIADIRMRGNLDLELVREARRIAQGIPIILITGYPSVDSAIRAIELPVAAYLIKPLRYPELRKHVVESLEYSSANRTLSNVQKHLGECLEDLNRIQSVGWSPVERPGSATPKVPLGTLRSLAACTYELMSLEMTVGPGSGTQHPCELVGCPQWPAQRETIRTSVKVLEQTKNRFKSKELGEIRKLLEGLLE